MNSIYLHSILSAPQVVSKHNFNVKQKERKKPPIEMSSDVNEKTRKEELNSNEVASSVGIGIPGFLKGKVFLVTGATGFLGKVLVEKILRAVPDVAKIYLLIRAEDEDSAMGRLKKEIIDTELFKSVRESHGQQLLNKLVPIVGNVGEFGLGMEVALANHVANEVDIIVNLAATTNFNERYDVALNTNTLGPFRLLSFAKKCKALRVFLHVSTAFVYGPRHGIASEKPLYMGDSIAKEMASLECPRRSFPLLDVDAEIELAVQAGISIRDKMAREKLKELGLERAKYFGWHDVYVFTKSMGEMIIESERQDIPIVIIRPSGIESTFKEPIPGWIDEISRCIDPLIVSYGKGELTGFPVKDGVIIDLVPADMVVNAILASIVKHATMKEPVLRVYHIASSTANPLVLRDMFNYIYHYFSSSPYMGLTRELLDFQRWKFFNSIDDFYTHLQSNTTITEAMFMETPDQESIKTIMKLAEVYEAYCFYEGRFDTSNTKKLWENLSQEEKNIFGFDISDINWKSYICDVHIPGLIQHAVKEKYIKAIASKL